MSRARSVTRRASKRGFTLIEMIVVTFLLLMAMLGLLAVFDASARINKSETDVADAQGAVRYGIYQMTRVIRMAGVGRALRHPGGPQLPRTRGIARGSRSAAARSRTTTFRPGRSVTKPTERRSRCAKAPT